MSQNTIRNDIALLEPQFTDGSESLDEWMVHYFRLAVTTSLASQKVQHRDFSLFLRYRLFDSIGEIFYARYASSVILAIPVCEPS